MSEFPDNSVAAIAAAAAIIGKPLAESGVRLLECVAGQPLQVAGAMLADQLYFRQTVQRLRMAARAKRLFDAAGGPPGVVPPGFLTAVLDGAGYADSDELEQLWAQLLVSASLDSRHANPAFAEVLRRMTPECARVFDRVARAELLDDAAAVDAIRSDVLSLGAEAEANEGYLAELAVLEACNVVHYRNAVVRHPGRSLSASSDYGADFGLTLFGELFFAAVNGLDPSTLGARSATAMAAPAATPLRSARKA